VIYVFGQKEPPVDVDDCVKRLFEAVGVGDVESRRVVVFRCEVGYVYQAGSLSIFTLFCLLSFWIDAIVAKLRERFDQAGAGIEVSYSAVTVSTATPPSSNEAVVAIGEGDGEDNVIIYVGGESLGLTNLLMTHASSKVRCTRIFYNPSTYPVWRRFTRTTQQRKPHNWRQRGRIDY
jgi:diphthamide biosynthesis protein 2